MTKPRFYIDGYLVGHIWMPAVECWKPLDYDLTREDERSSEPLSLREHVLRATNDGDFQSCVIAQGRLVATIERRTATGTIRRTREWSLTAFPSIADCLNDDPDWFPCVPEDEEEFA